VKARRLAIRDVVALTARTFDDTRGRFFEAWNARDFAALGIGAAFVQDNAVTSHRGVLRGMHCQVGQVQGKLIRVLAGEVFDVAVDLRPASPTFGRWVGERLSGENAVALWVPPGFAHGYLTLSDRAEVYYKCTDYYAPDHERVLAWNDPAVAIDWPLSELGGALAVELAERDRKGAALGDARSWFV
jgi:dTDP-4-dehydrorhamnose 3,5-epimerase